MGVCCHCLEFPDPASLDDQDLLVFDDDAWKEYHDQEGHNHDQEFLANCRSDKNAELIGDRFL